jgi:hypothetical protein
MESACEIADGQQNDPLFIGSPDPLVAILSNKGITEKQVWQCEVSLEGYGYVGIPRYIRADVDPTWSSAMPFEIKPIGLRWWLIRQYGNDGYSKMVSSIKKTSDECVRTGVLKVADWAEKLKLPLSLVEKILHAENLYPS